MANKLSVAFIGTGIMGAPIAGHILDAGYPVTVNNRTKSKAAALIERGAAWADTPADAAANADVVFTMVGYPSEVEELYLAGDGLLACTKPGAVLIDLTTSSPELARDIAEAAQVSGRMAFDCPVTGGESGAIAGTLTAIVGATENDIAPVRDILATFAANICCFDGAGKGQAAKLANQVSLGACMVGMADAMAFAELSGLDLEKTRQMILGGTGKSGAMESLAPKALDGDYKPGFMVEHFIKDLRLALAYADDRELAEAICNLYTSIGYKVFVISAKSGEGLPALSEFIKGKLTLLAGNSGVGKSSLINALVPGACLRTGEISDIHHTGTHTTTFSEMIDLPEGGAIIDIPGVRGFGTIDFKPEEVGHFFPEIFRHSHDCRYSDCKHTGEPGCAVVPAVEQHYISESRYTSYLSILEEASEKEGADKYRKPY